MKPYKPTPYLCMLLCLCILFPCIPASAQDTDPKRSGPINLDEALKEPVPENRAVSYYYFTLAKLTAGKGDEQAALEMMKKSLDYNPDSPEIHLELAILLHNMGRPQEALSYAEEAVRLDPDDPNPHWTIYSIYSNAQPNLNGEFKKAVQELEIIRDLDPENGLVHYELGRIYFDLNEPEKAIQSYEKFQSIIPETDAGYLEIAKYYYSNNNTEKTIEYLEKALGQQPDSIESLNFLRKLYLDLSRIRDAIPIYERLIRVTDNNPKLKQDLASLLYEVWEYDEAALLLEDVLAIDPENERARMFLGRIQIDQNKYDAATETLESIDSDDPDLQTNVQFLKGLAYKNNSKFPEAIEIFRNLLDSIPDRGEESRGNRLLFQYHLVSMYLKQGNKEEAVSVAKQGHENDPENLRMAIFYAQTLADAGEIDRSLEILNELLTANPSEIDLYVHKSQILLQEKRFAEAEGILTQAEKVQSDDETTGERLKIQRVSVYEQQKDYARAESLLNEVLKENPDHAGALNYLGYMLADRGVRLPEALDYVKKALLLDPENGAYLDSLGWAYFKMNDLENAEIYLLKAGKREKDDPVINDHLGDLYFKTGDLEKAREYWMQSIRLSTEEEEVQTIREKVNKLPANPKKNSQ